jgi:hypothetical protein
LLDNQVAPLQKCIVRQHRRFLNYRSYAVPHVWSKFRLRQHGTYRSSVYGFPAERGKTIHHQKQSTAVPERRRGTTAGKKRRPRKSC